MAVKVALEAFKGIVTLAGTTRAGRLELSPTTTAPLVAAALKLTVQVAEPPEDSELGAHPTDVRVTGAATLTLPPVAETVMAPPAGDAPRVPLTPIDTELALEASVAVTAATLPFGIVFVLSPLARHLYELALLTQESLLPEDVNTGPGATEKLVTLADG